MDTPQNATLDAGHLAPHAHAWEAGEPVPEWAANALASCSPEQLEHVRLVAEDRQVSWDLNRPPVRCYESHFAEILRCPDRHSRADRRQAEAMRRRYPQLTRVVRERRRRADRSMRARARRLGTEQQQHAVRALAGRRRRESSAPLRRAEATRQGSGTTPTRTRGSRRRASAGSRGSPDGEPSEPDPAAGLNPGAEGPLAALVSIAGPFARPRFGRSSAALRTLLGRLS